VLCRFANVFVALSLFSLRSRAAGADSVKKEIGVALALSFGISAIWWVWAKGQGRKLDKWNEKLRASKGQ
jgi:hypothetical protein